MLRNLMIYIDRKLHDRMASHDVFWYRIKIPVKYILTGCQGEGETLVLFQRGGLLRTTRDFVCDKTLVCDEEQACSRLLEVVLLLLSTNFHYFCWWSYGPLKDTVKVVLQRLLKLTQLSTGGHKFNWLPKTDCWFGLLCHFGRYGRMPYAALDTLIWGSLLLLGIQKAAQLPATSILTRWCQLKEPQQSSKMANRKSCKTDGLWLGTMPSNSKMEHGVFNI